MPLFIDLHIDPNLTLEDIKQYHLADKKVQDKYGVRYLQILLNKPQGHLFCLVEGPDKESCANCHREAHGNIACNVLEITQSDFSTLLQGKQKDGEDFTINSDGTFDSGVRAVLTFDIIGSPNESIEAKSKALEILSKHGGRNTESLHNSSTLVFHLITSAIDAAFEVKNYFDSGFHTVEIRQGISIGLPIEKEGNFFESTRISAGQFAFIADKNAVVMAANAKSMYTGKLKITEPAFKNINNADEKFLSQILNYLENSWASSDLSITSIAEEIGLSKSQLNRKLKSISSLSPNDLVKEFRLRKSIQFILAHGMNVAEVTMAIGFSNPSYFTKCFRNRFGLSPTEFALKK